MNEVGKWTLSLHHHRYTDVQHGDMSQPDSSTNPGTYQDAEDVKDYEHTPRNPKETASLNVFQDLPRKLQ